MQKPVLFLAFRAAVLEHKVSDKSGDDTEHQVKMRTWTRRQALQALLAGLGQGLASPSRTCSVFAHGTWVRYSYIVSHDAEVYLREPTLRSAGSQCAGLEHSICMAVESCLLVCATPEPWLLQQIMFASAFLIASQ